jgi:hypothetical protein
VVQFVTKKELMLQSVKGGKKTHSGAPTHHSNGVGDVVVCKSHNCQETRKLKQLNVLCVKLDQAKVFVCVT